MSLLNLVNRSMKNVLTDFSCAHSVSHGPERGKKIQFVLTHCDLLFCRYRYKAGILVNSCLISFPKKYIYCCHMAIDLTAIYALCFLVDLLLSFPIGIAGSVSFN